MLKHSLSMKQTSIFSLSTFAFFALIFASCSSGPCANKKQFLNSFGTFVEDVKKDKDMDDAQALAYQDEYKGMIEDCYKKFRADMTLEERQDFWKESVIFYFKSGGKTIDLKLGSENDEELNEYVQDELEAVIKESGDDFEKIIQEVITENVLPALNDIFKGIENLGKELQKAIE